jgi:glycosyltransferase involved in cell wall biosynthesis
VSMRVVHIINGLSVGGAEMMLYKLLSRMDRTRFEPIVVSLSGNGPLRQRITHLGVPVYNIGWRLGPAAPSAARRFMQIIRHTTPDLIQGWQYHGGLAARFAQMLLPRRVPVLWNIRHSVFDLGDEPRLTAAVVKLGARCSRTAARIIYVARTSAFQHEALGYRPDTRVVLPNGFDTECFVPSDEARLRLREELGLAPSTFVIGKIARYHRMKDHAGFFRAATLLLQSRPGVHFALAGDNVDRGNAELVKLIDTPTLAARTHLLGRRDDVHHLVAALDILTSASAYGEGFPNVIGEAMASGVPCVATDVGDSALIVGEFGRVVSPRQPSALAKAWASLLEMDRDGRVALGLMARRRIIEQYSLQSVAARYEELYDDVADRSLERTADPAAIRAYRRR